jgi:hypothetical protein
MLRGKQEGREDWAGIVVRVEDSALVWKTDTVPSFIDFPKTYLRLVQTICGKLQGLCCGCHYVALRGDKPLISFVFNIHALIGDVLSSHRNYNRKRYS